MVVVLQALFFLEQVVLQLLGYGLQVDEQEVEFL